MANKIIILTLLLVLVVGCKTANSISNDPKKQTESISLVALISNPDNYHNKVVRVQGYFIYEPEGNAVYLSKDDLNNGLTKNAVFLYINKDILDKNGIEKPYKGYMTITGLFNKNLKGSYDFYSGTIEEIYSIERMYKRGGVNDEFNMD